MVPTGRNSRAPGGSLLWLRVSPTKGKPPAASRLLEEQLQFHTQNSNISQDPSFPAGNQPRLLLASSSSPPCPPLQLLQRPTSTAGLHPAHTKPANPCDSREQDELWEPPVAAQTRPGQGGKMESRE